MENKVSFGLKIASGIVSILGIILVFIASTSDSPEVGGVLGLTQALFYIAIAASILFPIFVIVQDPKKAVTFLVGIAALGAIFGIAYGMSTEQVIDGVAVENSRIAEAGIITFYILFVIAVISLLIGFIKKLIS